MRIIHDAIAYARARVLGRRGGEGAVVVTHAAVPRTTVRQSPLPYHQMQGWQYADNSWTGQYRVPGVECPGQVWQNSKQFCARITSVPEAVLHGPHGGCFSQDPQAPGWYRIHFRTMPKTIDGTILAVEQTIQKSLK